MHGYNVVQCTYLFANSVMKKTSSLWVGSFVQKGLICISSLPLQYFSYMLMQKSWFWGISPKSSVCAIRNHTFMKSWYWTHENDIPYIWWIVAVGVIRAQNWLLGAWLFFLQVLISHINKIQNYKERHPSNFPHFFSNLTPKTPNHYPQRSVPDIFVLNLSS